MILGQTITSNAITATTASGTSTRWWSAKLPVSFAGVPFETVLGLKIAAAITITTLAAVKKSAWTTVAEVTPATDEPLILVRKIPIIAAVPACAGVTAFTAVPPCDAPQAVLNERPDRG